MTGHEFEFTDNHPGPSSRSGPNDPTAYFPRDGNFSDDDGDISANKAAKSAARNPHGGAATPAPAYKGLQPEYSKIIQPSPETGDAHNWYGAMMNGIGNVMGALGSIPMVFCCPNPYKTVLQGHVGLITRFGRFTHAVDPGLVRVNPLSERLVYVDVRTQIVEVPQQACMTKDNVSISITSVLYYRVVKPDHATFTVNNIRQALIERTQTTLRQVIGAGVLQDVIVSREGIAANVQRTIKDVAHAWGVEVESMLVKDIIFSQELQESLSMAAQSKRKGEAKIIVAKAEVESAKLMRQAADILASGPAMQIRYLEAMQNMAKTSGSKVIFLPAPNQSMPGLVDKLPGTVENRGGADFPTDPNHVALLSSI